MCGCLRLAGAHLLGSEPPVPARFISWRAQDFGLSKEGVDKFGGTKSFCGSVACSTAGMETSA